MGTVVRQFVLLKLLALATPQLVQTIAMFAATLKSKDEKFVTTELERTE